MNVPDIEYVIANSKNILWDIKNNYPLFYEYLMSEYPKSLQFSERLYWYYHGIKEHPTCNCGKDTKYINFRKGYTKYCSPTCANNDPAKISKANQTNVNRYGGTGNASKDLQSKAKKTCLERYGVEYYTQTKEYIDAAKQTNLIKYGSEWGLQNPEVIRKANNTYSETYGGRGGASSIIRKRMEDTCEEKYGTKHAMESPEIRSRLEKTNEERLGVKCPFQSNGIKDKSKHTMLSKYGVAHALENQDLKNMALESRQRNYMEKNPNIIGIEYTESDAIYTCKCPHPECNKCSSRTFVIPASKYCVRRYEGRELCTVLCPGSQQSDTSIEQFVKRILNSHNIEYECNNRSVLSGKEIDIYVPSKKIGIECNGIYWHSTSSPNKKPISYHFNKWKECKENGIQLLTIWEDQIINKPDIIESIILSKLGIYERRLYARNCQVKEVDSKECYSFLKTYHLQGASNSKVRYGLYYKDELVSVMTFGLKRKCMGGKGEWELHRYCNKKGVQVVGGASRLFKHFLNAQKPVFIESFSSNDISDGGLYDKLGFDMLKCEYGSYWYIDKNMNRHHRYNFRKDQLVKEGFDASKSEFTIMEECGYYRIYDSGQTKWVYNI